MHYCTQCFRIVQFTGQNCSRCQVEELAMTKGPEMPRSSGPAMALSYHIVPESSLNSTQARTPPFPIPWVMLLLLVGAALIRF